jgi:hypothetical protein
MVRSAEQRIRAQQWAAEVMGEDDPSPPYKRDPHRRHRNHLAELDSIVKALGPYGSVPHGGTIHLARRAHIPVTTLESWKQHPR